MKRVKLSSQLLILYTTVTVLSAVVFGLVTYRNYDVVYSGFARTELVTYVEAVLDEPKEFENKPYIGYIKAYIKRENLVEEVSGAMEVSPNVIAILDDEVIQREIVLAADAGFFEYKATDGITYYLSIKQIEVVSDTVTQYLIGVMDSKYVSELKRTSTQTDVLLSFIGTFVVFAVIIVVGNVILALWSREMTKRIQRLSQDISMLGKEGYEQQIEVTGSDEISELAREAEKMRQEIYTNEQTKQEMFQNLSHDFKTPIAVIRSYAEAIEDGISTKEEAGIIVSQAIELEKKVQRLLEYNKLEYIDSTVKLVDVKMKKVVNEVLEEYKILLADFKLVKKLDDSTFRGLKENYKTVVANILDNATRYAKSKIIIRLRNGKLSIYNDGEPIEQKYIDELFKPYEKGTKGQFGLGMSIVQKTVNRFGYSLTVENLDGGVVFSISR